MTTGVLRPKSYLPPIVGPGPQAVAPPTPTWTKPQEPKAQRCRQYKGRDMVYHFTYEPRAERKKRRGRGYAKVLRTFCGHDRKDYRSSSEAGVRCCKICGRTRDSKWWDTH